MLRQAPARRRARGARPPRPRRAHRPAALGAARDARGDSRPPGRRIHFRGCAAGSGPRPFPSIATRSRRSRWTPGWSRWPTTSPTACASTGGGSPRATATCSSARSCSSSSGALAALAVSGALPALDALLVAARVRAHRAGACCVATLALVALRRGPAAEAAVRQRPLRRRSTLPTGVLVLYGLLTLLFLVGARFAVHAFYERPLRGYRAAARRPLRPDRRRRRRRPPAAARDPAQPRPRLPARSASSTTTRASSARASTAASRCSARRSELERVLDDVEPDEVLIAIPSAPGTMRARVVSACRDRGVPGAHDADRVRAAADGRAARPPGARGARRGRPGARAGAHGGRARRPVPRRARACSSRARAARSAPSCAARSRASAPSAARAGRPRRGQPVRDRARARRGPPRRSTRSRCSPTARRRSACGRCSPSTARRSSSTPPPTSTSG